MKKFKVIRIIAPVIAFVVIFGAWEMIVHLAEIEAWLLPAPSKIFSSMALDFPEYWPHILMTLETILLGFVIAVPLGLLLASLISSSRLLSSALGPYIIFLVTTPLITLVPLLMLWMGFGMKVRVVTVIIQSFAVVNMNACTGFANVPVLRTELMQSLGASRMQAFFKVQLPSAAPDIFTGIRLAGIFATTACISAEYVGGSEGLGSRIIYYSQFLKSSQSFACIFYVMLLGVLLYCLTSLAQRLVIRWKI